MRVLFWSETFWPRVGGVETLAAHLLPALRARGHELAVVTWAGTEGPAEIRYDGMPVHRFPFFSAGGQPGADEMMEHLDQVTRLKRAFAPDLIHVNSYGRSAWFHLATAAVSPAPTLLTLHQALPAQASSAETLVRRLVDTASWITCCSADVLERTASTVAAARPRMSVVPNALPPPAACQAPAPLGPPRLLFVGRLVAEKGLDWLLPFLPALFSQCPDARLVVAGDGPLRPRVEQEAAALGLGAFVQFVGAVGPESVTDLISAATVVVVPSRSEGFGLVALEAALLGRPVVATRTGGLPEVVADGETGLLADPDDGRGFVEAVARLLGDPALARHMGAAARDRAHATFSWPRYVDAYEALYRGLGR